MALITKPAAFTASTLTPAQINVMMDTIYDEFGTTVNGQGNISDINCSTTMNLQRTKIADTAAVLGNSVGPGTQTFTRPSNVSGNGPFYETALGGWSPDTSAANSSAVAVAGVSQNFNLVAGKGLYTVTGAAASTVTTINNAAPPVTAVDGMVIWVLCQDANVTFVHTAGNVADSLKMRGGAAGGPPAAIQLFKFIRITNGGVGQWFQV